MDIKQLQFSQFTKGGEPKITLKYAVSGSDDEETVLSYAEGNTPATFKGLYRNEINGELVGPEEWDIRVTYGTVPPPAWYSSQINAEWSFSVDEETVHYSHSLETVSKYPATATDHKGSVNVRPDGTVEGYDSGVAALSWSETLYLPWSMWGASYLGIIRNAVGRWNATTFRVWAAGELLLRRARGKPAGQSYVQIEFDFTTSPNEASLTVGDITGIAKQGWDLLWIEYEPEVDTTSNALAGRPKHVYVERTRQSAEMHDLLLPDPFTT